MDGVAETELNLHGDEMSLSVSTVSETGTDGILSHENEELRDRVSVLEKKVQQQEDEIICLKSALSDAIRRLNALEQGRAFQNNLLPSKPTLRGTPRKLPVSPTTPSRESSRRSTSSSDSHHTIRIMPVPNRIVPRGLPGVGSTPNLNKWTGGSASERTNGHMSPTRRSGSMTSLSPNGTHSFTRGAKEPVYNAEEGILRIFLRGRAISMYAPSCMENYSIDKGGDLPPEKLKLEWVYGYRGRDARCNLYLLPTGEIIYFIASVVVLYNVEEQMQRHYLGHNDDVKCLAVHPDKITIASGQVAGHDKKEGRPHVRIWNSVNLNTLHIIGLRDFERAVACVGFSKADGGQHLVVVDDANEHVISLWDWQKENKITETKTSTEPVLCSEFHPMESNLIVTCGKSHLAMWTIEGSTLSKKQAIYERYDKPKFVTCMTFAENGDLVTGDSNGNLFIWSKGTNRVSQAVVGAHDGGIFSICVMKDGSLISGGKDRQMIQWNSEYQRTGVSHEIPDEYGAIRMLSQGKGNLLLVGTTRNCILQGTIDLKFSPIVQGHLDELWGLAVHPSQHQFVTAGYDRNLYLWDVLSHSAIWSMETTESVHCVCFHPEGNLVVAGTQTAKWMVIDLTTRDVVCTSTDGNEQIECVAYSPDGSLLAVGSRDNFIYVYHVSEAGRKYSRVGRCSGHSSFVTHIDWSSDNQYLQSNSGDYELLFWNGTTCRQVTSTSSLRDVDWATHSCTLGFNVCGIWPEGADGTDVNACTRSNNKNMAATGDDFGKVSLFTYPCNQPKSKYHSYGGHSSHVTNVRFLYDDSRLLSVGGKDTAILQWEVEK